MKQFMVDSPVQILLRTRKRDNKGIFFKLNINSYRNSSPFILAPSKKIYKDVMFSLLAKEDAHLMKFDKVEIIYQIIACNNKKFDSMNIIGVVDKYFQDVLVDNGIIKDDNHKIVKKITVLPVIIDKELPETIVRITVKEFNDAKS